MVMIPKFLEIPTEADYENKKNNNYYHGQYKYLKYS